MKNPEILSTKDYDLFFYHENQQPTSPAHIANLAASMLRDGFWQSSAIAVVREGKRLKIVDGHHRFNAAKQLGIAVLYVIEKQSFSERIGDKNRLVRKWSSASFAKMYADRGNSHYKELIDAAGAGIPISVAASILAGECGSSNNAARLIPSGSFTVKTRIHVDVVTQFMRGLEAIAPEVRSRSFITALSTLLFITEFDSGIMFKRIQANPRSLVKCSTRDQMLELLEEIYNYRSSNKVRIASLALDAARERSAVKR